jgi:hypothetical protein
VGRSRQRRNRAEADAVAAEYEASGLSREEFCRQQGMAVSTLARYQRRRRQDPGGGSRGDRWVTVEVTGPRKAVRSEASSGLVVVAAGGRRIEVERGFDGDTLRELLRVLESA